MSGSRGKPFGYRASEPQWASHSHGRGPRAPTGAGYSQDPSASRSDPGQRGPGSSYANQFTTGTSGPPKNHLPPHHTSHRGPPPPQATFRHSNPSTAPPPHTPHHPPVHGHPAHPPVDLGAREPALPPRGRGPPAYRGPGGPTSGNMGRGAFQPRTYEFGPRGPTQPGAMPPRGGQPEGPNANPHPNELGGFPHRGKAPPGAPTTPNPHPPLPGAQSRGPLLRGRGPIPSGGAVGGRGPVTNTATRLDRGDAPYDYVKYGPGANSYPYPAGQGGRPSPTPGVPAGPGPISQRSQNGENYPPTNAPGSAQREYPDQQYYNNYGGQFGEYNNGHADYENDAYWPHFSEGGGPPSSSQGRGTPAGAAPGGGDPRGMGSHSHTPSGHINNMPGGGRGPSEGPAGQQRSVGTGLPPPHSHSGQGTHPPQQHTNATGPPVGGSVLRNSSGAYIYNGCTYFAQDSAAETPSGGYNRYNQSNYAAYEDNNPRGPNYSAVGGAAHPTYTPPAANSFSAEPREPAGPPAARGPAQPASKIWDAPVPPVPLFVPAQHPPTQQQQHQTQQQSRPAEIYAQQSETDKMFHDLTQPSAATTGSKEGDAYFRSHTPPTTTDANYPLIATEEDHLLSLAASRPHHKPTTGIEDIDRAGSGSLLPSNSGGLPESGGHHAQPLGGMEGVGLLSSLTGGRADDTRPLPPRNTASSQFQNSGSDGTQQYMQQLLNTDDNFNSAPGRVGNKYVPPSARHSHQDNQPPAPIVQPPIGSEHRLRYGSVGSNNGGLPQQATRPTEEPCEQGLTSLPSAPPVAKRARQRKGAGPPPVPEDRQRQTPAVAAAQLNAAPRTGHKPPTPIEDIKHSRKNSDTPPSEPSKPPPPPKPVDYLSAVKGTTAASSSSNTTTATMLSAPKQDNTAKDKGQAPIATTASENSRPSHSESRQDRNEGKPVGGATNGTRHRRSSDSGPRGGPGFNNHRRNEYDEQAPNFRHRGGRTGGGDRGAAFLTRDSWGTHDAPPPPLPSDEGIDASSSSRPNRRNSDPSHPRKGPYNTDNDPPDYNSDGEQYKFPYGGSRGRGGRGDRGGRGGRSFGRGIGRGPYRDHFSDRDRDEHPNSRPRPDTTYNRDQRDYEDHHGYYPPHPHHGYSRSRGGRGEYGGRGRGRYVDKYNNHNSDRGDVHRDRDRGERGGNSTVRDRDRDRDREQTRDRDRDRGHSNKDANDHTNGSIDHKEHGGSRVDKGEKRKYVPKESLEENGSTTNKAGGSNSKRKSESEHPKKEKKEKASDNGATKTTAEKEEST